MEITHEFRYCIILQMQHKWQQWDTPCIYLSMPHTFTGPQSCIILFQHIIARCMPDVLLSISSCFTQENAYAMLESHLRKLRKTSRNISNSSGCMVETGTCSRYDTTFNHIKSKLFVFGLKKFSLAVSTKTSRLPVHTFYSSLKTHIVYLIKFMRAWWDTVLFDSCLLFEEKIFTATTLLAKKKKKNPNYNQCWCLISDKFSCISTWHV